MARRAESVAVERRPPAAQAGQSGEEHIDRDLQARLRHLENVLGSEHGEGLDEEAESDGEEYPKSARNGRRHRLNGQSMLAGSVLLPTVVGYGLGEENRSEENQEGLYAGRRLAH